MTWDEVRAWLLACPAGTEVWIRRGAIAHPRELGAALSVGLPRGQQRDWRFAPDEACRGVHVLEYRSRYRVHLDAAHPACGLVAHFLRDVLPGRWASSRPLTWPG